MPVQLPLGSEEVRISSRRPGESYLRQSYLFYRGSARSYRAPHIHFAVSRNGQRLLTTQMLIRNHPANERDNILGGVRDPKARESVLVDFKPSG